MTGLTVIARAKAKAGREKELEQAMRAVVTPTHQESGCLRYPSPFAGRPGRVYYGGAVDFQRGDRSTFRDAAHPGPDEENSRSASGASRHHSL